MNEPRIPPRASAATARRTTQAYALPQQPRPAEWEDEERETHASRFPRSARRYTTEAPQERSLVPASSLPRARRHRHPALYLGLGMLGTTLCATLLLGPVGSWWTDWRNYTAYGDPRTYQVDAVVGQQDSPTHPSHFVALNLHGELLVLEFPGGDVSHAREWVVTTLTGPEADRVPITLAFRDVNGDGKPDLLIQFAGQEVIYLNEQGTFRPARPGEVTQP